MGCLRAGHPNPWGNGSLPASTCAAGSAWRRPTDPDRGSCLGWLDDRPLPPTVTAPSRRTSDTPSVPPFPTALTTPAQVRFGLFGAFRRFRSGGCRGMR